jgi:hypothetical protein
MSRTEIGAIRKADGAEVRVSIQNYKGRRVLDIRIWYQPAANLSYVPTRKGVTVDADKLSGLMEILTCAEKAIDDRRSVD